MRNGIVAFAGLAALGLAGCAHEADVEPIATSGEASAQARGPGGSAVAEAVASETSEGLSVRVTATGLAPGAYGAHIHTVGRCDPPGFESAGSHWNPTDREHGMQNPQGPHLGDLPNLMVGANGEGSFELRIPGARLAAGPRAMLDGDGAALVIHAGADDYRTDPSGNSGARIACGVFG